MTISQFPLPEGGIPTGNTAGRPANPSIGDVYYNGQRGLLEIFDGTNFIPCSAPAAPPTIAVVDVGTSRAFGSAQGTVTFTAGVGGGVDSFIVSSSTGGYTATTTGTTVTITVGNSGSYTFSGTAINPYGESVSGPTVTETLTTVPEAPTIGTATTSGSTTDVTVTWTLGNNGDKNLSAITVTPFLNGTTAQTATTAATTSSTSATIVGLTQGSAYTFKVKTTNANGDSADSNATNSITVPSILSFTLDYLVLAGGGGGGATIGSSTYVNGGGGAGGLRTSYGNVSGGGGAVESSLTRVTGINYTVTVAAGGTAASGFPGGKGADSVFDNITSLGGTAPNTSSTRNTGGCGGGSGSFASGGACFGTSGQGFGGSNAENVGSNSQGGAGGGTGAAGGSSNSGNEGRFGGNGTSANINGNAVIYGGGGGGGGGVGGIGGNGGGGAGSTINGNRNPGEANKGGGGGGKQGNTNTGNTSAEGGNGGSGIVILRYPNTRTITLGVGLTGTTNTVGSDKVTAITAGTGNVSWS